MSDKIAKTILAHDDKPDHTVFAHSDLRRSFNSDKGANVRDVHVGPNMGSGRKSESVNTNGSR